MHVPWHVWAVGVPLNWFSCHVFRNGAHIILLGSKHLTRVLLPLGFFVFEIKSFPFTLLAQVGLELNHTQVHGFFVLSCFVFETGSQLSSLTGLKLRDTPASQELELKVCTSAPVFIEGNFLFKNYFDVYFGEFMCTTCMQKPSEARKRHPLL